MSAADSNDETVDVSPETDNEFITDFLIKHRLITWYDKATQNVDKWGLQDLGTLLLATQEELAEVGEEAEQHLDTDEVDLQMCLGEMIDAGFHIQATHEDLYEDENGDPIPEDERPEFEFDADPERLDAIEEELADTAALLIQIQAAINRARTEQYE